MLTIIYPMVVERSCVANAIRPTRARARKEGELRKVFPLDRVEQQPKNVWAESRGVILPRMLFLLFPLSPKCSL
jgi:hypothetical protein